MERQQIQVYEALIMGVSLQLGHETVLAICDDTHRQELAGCDECEHVFHGRTLAPCNGLVRVCPSCRATAPDILHDLQGFLGYLASIALGVQWYEDEAGRLRGAQSEQGVVWEHTPLTWAAYCVPNGGLYDPTIDWDCAVSVLVAAGKLPQPGLVYGTAIAQAEDKTPGYLPALATAVREATLHILTRHAEREGQS